MQKGAVLEMRGISKFFPGVKEEIFSLGRVIEIGEEFAKWLHNRSSAFFIESTTAAAQASIPASERCMRSSRI